METVFLKIFNMSITAGWLVLAVLLLRPLLKNAPRFLVVIMWALVGIRLVLPFSFESVLSLIPSTETVPPEILYDRSPQIQTGIAAINSAVNPVISESFAPDPLTSVNPLQIITWLAAWIWVIGIAAMMLYSLISYLRIYRKVREAAPLQGNVWLCDRIDTPFIFGLFRPRIYLPSAMAGEDIPYVIAHEQAHLKRRDHLWKPLGFLLLTVYWFNPLLWVAYILLCRDIEVACDEKVLKTMGDGIKKPYSQALINCSVPRRAIAACPLAFGEVSVKSRIKKVLHYKKPAFWLLIAAVVTCAVLSVCFLTNPKSLPADLQVFLDCQIAERHQSDKTAGNASCVDYQVLGTKKQGSTTTVYMWVLYEEYSYENGQLQLETGAHTPTVITAAKENGSYTLVEYWKPRDGTYYKEDIKAKFPWYLYHKAIDSQRYIDKQQAACLEMAEEYFAENPAASHPITDPSSDLDALKEELVDKQQAAALAALTKKYPQYFGLPTGKGLVVYVWQMAPDSYSWGLLPGRNAGYGWDDWMELESCSLEEMRSIVDSYGLDRSMVTICPIQMPYSSYAYTIDDAYRQAVEDLFWYGMDTGSIDWSHVILDYARGLIDAVDFDIDGDGTKELCELHSGPTSGLFTFVLVAYENGDLEYGNLFLSDGGDLSFKQQSDGTVGVLLIPSSSDDELLLYDISLSNGNIQLTLGNMDLPSWGPQGVDAVIYDDLELRMQLEWEDNNVLNAVFDYRPTTTPAGTLTTTSEYELYVIHNEKRWPFADYVRKVMGLEYPAQKAQIQRITYPITPDQPVSIPIYLNDLGIDLPAGTYEVCKEVQLRTDSGIQTREYTGRFSIGGEHVPQYAYIELTYHGNRQNALIIDDPKVCGYLLAQISNANGVQFASTKGHYGIPYSLAIYQDGEAEPFVFSVWDKDTYSTSAHTDSEGYQYFCRADIAELYEYLETNYPAEFWYADPGGTSVHEAFDITVSYAGDVDAGALYTGALNTDKMAISSVRHLPIYKFDTLEDLQQFKLNYVGTSTSDVGWNEVPSFNAATTKYDDAFFEENTLLLVYVSCSNCTHRFDVESIYRDSQTLYISVEETTGAEEVDDAEADWFITIAVPDSMIKTCKQFDADLGGF